jgi:hypothetical protein
VLMSSSPLLSLQQEIHLDIARPRKRIPFGAFSLCNRFFTLRKGARDQADAMAGRHIETPEEWSVWEEAPLSPSSCRQSPWSTSCELGESVSPL